MKKGEKRKQELLGIAYDMFLSKGYENTSVDEIIEKAGIAKGTYYYHFESKEQMLEEVIEMMLASAEEKAGEVIGSDIPVAEKVIAVISAFRPEGSETALQDTLNRPENIIMHEKINRRYIEKVVPILSEAAEQGVKEGLFACDNIPRRMRMIMILSSAMFDDGDYTKEDIDVFIDTIERILYAKKGSLDSIRGLIVK